MLNNAEPCRRALCSCCVRRTMKDSPSDSWLHLAGSITLSLSFRSLSLLPSLVCGPEWQRHSRLGINQSLPSSSVPSACQPARLLIPGRNGTLLGGNGEGGGRTAPETKARLAGGTLGELGQVSCREGGCWVRQRKDECQEHKGKDRTAALDWNRARHIQRAVWGIKAERPHPVVMNFRLL